MYAAVVTALLAASNPASAQIDVADWGPTVRITPFLAISPGFTQVNEATILTNNVAVGVRDVETRFNSGFGMGLNAEFRFWDALTLVGTGMWTSRADAFLIDLGDSTTYEIDGTNLWVAKVGLGLQLYETDDLKLSDGHASVFIGPAIVVDDPKSEPTTPAAARKATRQTALNIGAEGEIPFWNDRVAFMGAVEDFIIFWDEAASGRVTGALERAYTGSRVLVASKQSHMWNFRFGIALRF
jgi:hypothetical protein